MLGGNTKLNSLTNEDRNVNVPLIVNAISSTFPQLSPGWLQVSAVHIVKVLLTKPRFPQQPTSAVVIRPPDEIGEQARSSSSERPLLGQMPQWRRWLARDISTADLGTIVSRQGQANVSQEIAGFEEPRNEGENLTKGHWSARESTREKWVDCFPP